MNMELHNLISVTDTIEAGVYLAEVDITDVEGNRYIATYASREGDTFGLAPQVRVAIAEWIAGGNPVIPYALPAPEELREAFPSLNPAQIRLGLLSIGITEAMVEEALVDDPAGLTEWRYRPSYRRLHPLVEALASPEHFDLPPEQVDALWLWAAEL